MNIVAKRERYDDSTGEYIDTFYVYETDPEQVRAVPAYFFDSLPKVNASAPMRTRALFLYRRAIINQKDRKWVTRGAVWTCKGNERIEDGEEMEIISKSSHFVLVKRASDKRQYFVLYKHLGKCIIKPRPKWW